MRYRRGMDDDSASEHIRKGAFRPRTLAPFFVLTALFHALCVLTRFDDVARAMPAGVGAGLLLATFPLLFIEGYFESRLDYGESLSSLPIWMRIKSKPVKFSFTFAFTYLAIVVLQTWDISIGPIDPTPPPEWPLAQRAQFFAMMSFGMFFPNYLAATGFLVPALRKLGALFQRLPAFLAIFVLGLLGMGAGYGVVTAFASVSLGSGIESASGMLDAITERPAVAIGLAFGGVLVPMIYGALVKSDEDD